VQLSKHNKHIKHIWVGTGPGRRLTLDQKLALIALYGDIPKSARRRIMMDRAIAQIAEGIEFEMFEGGRPSTFLLKHFGH
jgi:hypothetical protein